MDTSNSANSVCGTTSTYTDFSKYCPNRLPCGYCTIMSRVCPLWCGVSWSEVTCENRT